MVAGLEAGAHLDPTACVVSTAMVSPQDHAKLR
jgi:hypothetical protein